MISEYLRQHIALHRQGARVAKRGHEPECVDEPQRVELQQRESLDKQHQCCDGLFVQPELPRSQLDQALSDQVGIFGVLHERPRRRSQLRSPAAASGPTSHAETQPEAATWPHARWVLHMNLIGSLKVEQFDRKLIFDIVNCRAPATAEPTSQQYRLQLDERHGQRRTEHHAPPQRVGGRSVAVHPAVEGGRRERHDHVAGAPVHRVPPAGAVVARVPPESVAGAAREAARIHRRLRGDAGAGRALTIAGHLLPPRVLHPVRLRGQACARSPRQSKVGSNREHSLLSQILAPLYSHEDSDVETSTWNDFLTSYP